MKTTLNISEPVMKQLKEESAKTGKTMSSLVECALRTLLAKPRMDRSVPPLPKFSCGVPRVNVSSRDALYDLMDEA